LNHSNNKDGTGNSKYPDTSDIYVDYYKDYINEKDSLYSELDQNFQKNTNLGESNYSPNGVIDYEDEVTMEQKVDREEEKPFKEEGVALGEQDYVANNIENDDDEGEDDDEEDFEMYGVEKSSNKVFESSTGQLVEVREEYNHSSIKLISTDHVNLPNQPEEIIDKKFSKGYDQAEGISDKKYSSEYAREKSTRQNLEKFKEQEIYFHPNLEEI